MENSTGRYHTILICGILRVGRSVYNMVSINDRRIIEVEVVDNGEKLVNILDLPKVYLPSQIVIDDEERKEKMVDSTTPYLRETAKEMLSRVIGNLPNGYSILLREGYREYDVQKGLFKEYFDKFKEKYPELSDEEIDKEVRNYVSDPDIFSPHVTGGAIDLALLDRDRRMLDVGQWLEDPRAANFDYIDLTREQRENRDLLKSLMINQGFVNYPYEWWHYSYGDRYWGYVKDKKAVYDTVSM
jgi:D-alanyl-D-alanine dipeptidase